MRRIRDRPRPPAAASPARPGGRRAPRRPRSCTPSPIATARASARAAMRQKPPGMTLPAVRRRRREDAQHEGPRHERAVFPDRRRRQPHDLLPDIVDRPRASMPRADALRARRRRARRQHDLRRREARHGWREGAGMRQLVEVVQDDAALAPAGRTTRSRCSAGRGPRRSGAGRGPAGSRAARWLSRTPEPGALATATPPARIAWTRPGTPRREAAFSSRGSAKSASTRRQMTSMRFSPAMVRTCTRPSCTARSSPSTRRKPR